MALRLPFKAVSEIDAHLQRESGKPWVYLDTNTHHVRKADMRWCDRCEKDYPYQRRTFHNLHLGLPGLKLVVTVTSLTEPGDKGWQNVEASFQ